jgi:hypothetical protein
MEKIEIGQFGKGRYSGVMGELYKGTIRLLGFSTLQAHATATRIGIDLGRLQASTDVKVGLSKKINKDGYRTVKEACSAKLPNSWAMSIMVITNGLDELRKQGLEVVENTVQTQLIEFVNNAAKSIQEHNEAVEAEIAAAKLLKEEAEKAAVDSDTKE